jgi:hypothetical protein
MRALPILPDPNARWTPARKYAVLTHLDAAPGAAPDLMRRYNLTDQEVGFWRRGLDRAGHGGLRVTRIPKGPR